MTTPEPPPEGQPYYAGASNEPPVAPYQSAEPYQQYPPAPADPYAAQQYPPAYPPAVPPAVPPAYPPQQPPYPYVAYAPARPTNGMAIASMVLGILWIYWIGSILALIFGYVARNEIKRTGANGDGMAIAGIVLGWVGVGILCVVLIVVATNVWA